MAESNLNLFESASGKPLGSTPLFTVSGFISAMNQTLSTAYPEVEIEGEVSSFNVNQGKFVFFDIKDEQASVNCFMMVFSLRVPLEDGMKVKVTATPKLTDKGRFSLTVKKIELSGEGSLKRAFELLRAKLAEEGLFDIERKRPLPQFPLRVGIIASETSAGYGDFKKIANALWGGVRFDLAHVQVQGETAPGQIVKAIRYMNELAEPPEALALIRGGGSLEDLAAFNDEEVARTVAASRIVTLVGVGHEEDLTLAGLAADVRASTPSNAAQLLLPDKGQFLDRVDNLLAQVGFSLHRLLDGKRENLVGLIEAKMANLLESFAADVQLLTRALRAYDPKQILSRGYGIARIGGKVLRSGRAVQPGDAVMLELVDANIDTEVKHVNEK